MSVCFLYTLYSCARCLVSWNYNKFTFTRFSAKMAVGEQLHGTTTRAELRSPVEASVPAAGSVACGAEERGLMRERADDARARAS